MKVQEIRKIFIEKYKNKDFILDKTGCKLIELIGVSIDATTEEVPFGKINREYVDKEIAWYNSQSLNVNDLSGKTPKAWEMTADKHGNINSNYGWCIFSEQNGSQYENAIAELSQNKDSRRAVMIYTRPSMHLDWQQGGKNDFMCTNGVQLLMRDSKLHYIVNQRSCDILYGYKNDQAWHRYVVNKLVIDLQSLGVDVLQFEITMQFGSLHAYEKHFHLIKE